MRSVRVFASGITVLLLATVPAGAGDYLRGSQVEPPPLGRVTVNEGTDWSGFYFGAHTSYNSMRTNFAPAADILSMQAFNGIALWQQVNGVFTLGKGGDDRVGFGGFVGYNMMFGDVMIGGEIDFTKVHMTSKDTNSVTRTYADVATATMTSSPAMEILGTQTDVSITGQAKVELRDLAIAKARFGYAFGNFMPFGTVGIAGARYKTDNIVSQTNASYNIGQGFNTVTDPATGNVTRSTPNGFSGRILPAFFTGASSAGSPRSGYAVGLALGMGVDALIANNILLRAEYQRVFFNDVQSIGVHLDQARVAAAVKF